MRRLRSEPCQGLRGVVFGAAAVATAIALSATPVEARYHRYQARYVHRTVAASHGYHHAHAESYTPPSSAIVVDGNTGAVLYAANADALRHPASLTKIMTLYLLFERLEAGRIKLDTPLKVSAHAAEQAPTKLGVKPGQTLAVEDAIKAVVTKSANDAAVAIAENLGGDEDAVRQDDDCQGACARHEPHHLRQRLRPTERRSDHHRRTTRHCSAARSRSAFRATTGISRPNNSSITVTPCATITTCSAWSAASTASRPAIPMHRDSTSSPRFIATDASSSRSCSAAVRPVSATRTCAN